MLSYFAREIMFWFCLVQTSFGGKLLKPFHALVVGSKRWSNPKRTLLRQSKRDETMLLFCLRTLHFSQTMKRWTCVCLPCLCSKRCFTHARGASAPVKRNDCICMEIAEASGTLSG